MPKDRTRAAARMLVCVATAFSLAVASAYAGDNSPSLASPSQASSYPDYNTSPPAPDMSGMELSAADVAGRLSLGWNIGNTLEAIGGETAWGSPLVTRSLIERVKESGFDAVRIPVSWDQYAQRRSGRIDPGWLARVEDVVRFCLENDLHVVLNVHWDGGWLENNVTPISEAAVAARQRAYWQQIATHFRDFDGRLMFASANEPDVDSAEEMAVLMRLHQTFIDTVRETGGRNAYRVLIVQGPRTDFEQTNNLWRAMPRDTVPDRLMMELHFYTPYNFTLMSEDQDWGRRFYYWGSAFHSPTDPDHNPTWGEEAQIADLFSRVRRQFVDQGVPVIIGEFGAMRRDNLRGEERERHLASRAYYLQFVTQQAASNGMIPFYWDSGAIDNSGSGVFNRRDNTVFDPQAIDAMIEGARMGRASFRSTR